MKFLPKTMIVLFAVGAMVVAGVLVRQPDTFDRFVNLFKNTPPEQTPSPLPQQEEGTQEVGDIPVTNSKPTTREREKEPTIPPSAIAPEPIPPPPKEPREYTIALYSSTDWRPASLTIYEGDTVTFVNYDEFLHWPGADPHPTHSSLPAFDALGGISKGQSYSHTFRKPGRYGHHDHIPENPPTVGFITVLAKP